MICLCIVSQALDGDFSDENRERCRVATTPLIEAVDNLSTFASNPEFASIPAQISHEVMKYWIPQYFMYYLLCVCVSVRAWVLISQTFLCQILTLKPNAGRQTYLKG